MDNPVVLPLKDYDSSTDGESSGNESSTWGEVRAKYRNVRKRRNRSQQTRINKRQRKAARQAEIEVQMVAQDHDENRRDYIIMEYLQHGNLMELINKLVEQKDKGGDATAQIPNRVLWAFWLCSKLPIFFRFGRVNGVLHTYHQ